MEKRNLAAAYKFYCGHKMEDDFAAHRADQDTEATYRVLQGELDMYSSDKQEEEDRILENDMDKLAEFSKTNDNVDFSGRIVWKEMKADALRRDPGYYNWICTSDFTSDTKQVLTRIRLRDMGK